MKKYLIMAGIAVGLFVGGCFTGYYLGLPDKVDTTEYVKTEQISGEKITHDQIKVEKEYIYFNTTSEGKGEIKTVIQKTVIPEARYWIEKTNIVQIEVDNYLNIRGAYLRRFGVFAVGAGLQVPTDKDSEFAIYAVGQYMF